MTENIRTDYEIVVKEGQKISDCFHEVGLPVKTRGKRRVYVVLNIDEDIPYDELERNGRLVESELYDWGFLDGDMEHDVTCTVNQTNEFSLNIYTL